MSDVTTNLDHCLIIASDGKSYHPVATNHYTITINLPEGLINQADPDKRPFSKADSQLTLKIANDNIAEPAFNQQKLKLTKGNLSIEFPGAIDPFTGTANFHVFVTKSAYDILYSWKLASGNHITGEIGDPDDYWATVMIDVTTGNKGTLVGTWTWNNCWLPSLQGINFDNNQSQPKTCNVTMSYFKPDWTGAQYAD